MHVCMECFEIYDKRFLNDRYDEIPCPKEDCSGDVVELDELIAPTIILLNEKGYCTKFCCSGHWYSHSSTVYIFFFDDCVPPYIPKSFKWDDYREPINTMRARYDEKSDESKYDFVVRMNKELFEWAINLPENEEW